MLAAALNVYLTDRFGFGKVKSKPIVAGVFTSSTHHGLGRGLSGDFSGLRLRPRSASSALSRLPARLPFQRIRHISPGKQRMRPHLIHYDHPCLLLTIPA